MKISEAYPSKYLTADDLGDEDHVLTIEEAELEEIGQGASKDNKIVITFKENPKKFVVNRTNANTISKVLGDDDTDAWLGQKIVIGPREVEFKGDMVMAIRVSLKRPGAKKPVAPKSTPDDDGWNPEG